METEIYESDPFTAKKERLLTKFTSDYRFQKGDEIFIEEGGRPLKVRVSYVQVRIRGGSVEQELLVLRI